MKRKFVKVMFFGALALSAVTYVGCKDYDDDIKNVQEQIDAINKKGADVTTEAMTAAINSAVAGLQTQLDAIAGKADKTALDELKKTVTDLQAALNNKADAAKITELQTKLDEAIAKVNASIESSVGAAKTELQAKIDKLQADLEKADADAAEKIATELAAAKTELQGLINANGDKIADLYEKIEGLDAIKTKIGALEEADKNFVTISQLNDYMNSEAVKEYVDEALVDYLTSAEVTEQVNAVKTYVDGTFKAAIMAEIKAEYLSLEKYDADMEALMEKIDTYVGKEDAAYKKIFTDITDLQTYQQQTVEVLVASLAENNTIENANKIVGALKDITTLQKDIAKCAKTTDLDAYVKGTELDGLIDEHLQTKFAGYDEEIADIKKRLLALEIDVDGLKSMVQSVTFVPSDAEGKVYFSSYYVVPEGETAKTLVASNNTVTVKFRVSPVSAAKNFFDNYATSFDAQVITRAINIFEGEGKVENADEGIISFVLSTTTEQSHAVCLNIVSKKSVPENAETAIKGTDYFTNINSNYFPVIVTTKTISSIQVESTNSAATSIYYNKEASKIDYKAGAALKASFVDGGDAILDPKNVDLSNFVTKYEFEKDMTDPDAPVILDGGESYKLEDGVLSLKNYAVESVGKQATVVAYVTVNDGDKTLKEFKSTAYAQVTAANYTDGTVNLTSTTPTAVQYDGTKEIVTTAYALTELYTEAGSKDIYEAIPVNKFTPTADKGVTFVIGEKNALTVTVPKGTPAGTYSPTLKIQVDAVKVINVSASVKVSYQNIKVAIDDNIVNANNAMTLKPTYQGSYDKPTSVGFTLDLTTLYTNYAPQLTAVKKVGGDITLNLKDAVKGVTINGTTLTVDKTYNANAEDIKPIVVVAKTVYGEATLEGSTLETKINLTDISGTWAFTTKTAAFGKDNLNSTLNLATTASWTDYRGNKMWEKGAELQKPKTGEWNWGAAPLSVYGFAAPVFSLAENDPNAKYVDITTDGNISLTPAGKNLVSEITLTVNVAVVSNWGTITGLANNNKVTVKIDLSKESAAIN